MNYTHPTLTWWPNRSRVSRSRIGGARPPAVKGRARVVLVLGSGVSRRCAEGEFVVEAGGRPAVVHAVNTKPVVFGKVDA